MYTFISDEKDKVVSKNIIPSTISKQTKTIVVLDLSYRELIICNPTLVEYEKGECLKYLDTLLFY